MPTVNVNNVALYYQLSGQAGSLLAMVHGAWWSHRSWEAVAPALAQSVRLLTYDRQGHTASERPELLRGVIVHEPALFGLLADDPATAAMLDIVRDRIRAVVERISSGDHEEAAKQFFETVAGKSGRWRQLSPDYQRIIIGNAPAFLQRMQDPEVLVFELAWLRGFSKPLLLTHGDQSAPFYAEVIRRITAAAPHAKMLTFEGAAHVPQRTHPDAYVEAVTSFMEEHAGSG